MALRAVAGAENGRTRFVLASHISVRNRGKETLEAINHDTGSIDARKELALSELDNIRPATVIAGSLSCTPKVRSQGFAARGAAVAHPVATRPERVKRSGLAQLWQSARAEHRGLYS
jgi:hypothetical protein